MLEKQPHNSRHAIAERNVGAILDGAQRVLQRGEQVSISGVAAEAGVSRPTVYAHFPDLERLLEALVERTVRRTMAAVESAEPDRGHAIDALQRLLASSWEELSRHADIARASAADLSADAMQRAHHTARTVIRRLIERGRREGVFRTDVAVSWLVTTCLALIHAAAEEVRTGELSSKAALDALLVTVLDLFTRPSAAGHLAKPRTQSPPKTRNHASPRR